LEGALEQRDRIYVVAGEEFLVSPGDAAWGIDQALTRGVVASPTQQGAHRLFGLFTGWPIGRGRGLRGNAGGRDDVHRARSFRVGLLGAAISIRAAARHIGPFTGHTTR